MSIPTYTDFCAIAYPAKYPEPQAPRPVRHWCGCGRPATEYIQHDEPWVLILWLCESCADRREEELTIKSPAQKNERP